LVLGLAVAGCLGITGSEPVGEGALEETGDEPLRPGEETDGDGQEDERDANDTSERNEGTDGNETRHKEEQNRVSNESATRERPPWPDPGDAGVRVANCTANFLFESAVNDSVYLGLAAHCVTDREPGDTVDVAGEIQARIAYCAYWTGDDHSAKHRVDFALLEIPRHAWNTTHPAVLHYGGPTGLAGVDAISPGDRVLYHTRERVWDEAIQETNTVNTAAKEGYVTNTRWEDAFSYVGEVTQGGDSGSPILLSDGRAAGVHIGVLDGQLSHLLEPALEQAEQRGFDVELVTWEVFEEGRAPDLPDEP
jgi:hypothetical protein